MPILRDLRETEFLQIFQSLPTAVQEKIRLIEVLYDRAVLYLYAKEGAAAGVPDFSSYLRKVYENRIKSAPKNNESWTPKESAIGPHYPGFEYEAWIEVLGDSRYRPSTDLMHLVMMCATLWIYWNTWPFSRKIFEAGKEIQLSNAVPGNPPSAPSFEATLDRSLVWLALSIGIETANIKHWGKKREDFARENLKKKNLATMKKTKVLEIYHISSRIKVGMNKDNISRIIKDVFKEHQDSGNIPKTIDLPSHYQIKRYLEEEGIIEYDFKRFGRRWIKQT